MAFRMLGEAGFALPWMETRKEIEKQLDGGAGRPGSVPGTGGRRRWLPGSRPPLWRTNGSGRRIAFQAQIVDANRHIFDYNLEVPLPRVSTPAGGRAGRDC